MSHASLRRRFAVLALALPLLSSAQGCVTCALWDHVDKKKTSHCVAAGLVTPVTLAVDAAIVAGGVVLLLHGTPCPSTMGDPAGVDARSGDSCTFRSK